MRNVLRSLGLAAVLASAAGWSEEAHAKFVFPYNHPDLEWYSIETEHFVVHYPQSKTKEGNDHYLTAEWTAKKSAKVAEEMWPRMCAEFNYFLKEKVHIVILNQSDDLEGFTIPSWDWIEVSANPGGNFYRQRGRMDWLPDVLVHEFAHVVSLKANASMAEGAGGVNIGGLYSDGLHDTENGGEISILDADPFYWTEGGAEYWSDETGYNWWTPSRDMHIRTTVLEDRLLSYEEWQTRAQQFRWGDGERGYQQGYSFALYLRQRFGNETYQRFALEGAKRWRMDWNTVIEEVTGVPAKQLYVDWVAYLQDKYGAQYAAVKAQGEVAGREVGGTQAWDFKSPEDRDKFFDLRWKRKKGVTGPELARIEREKAKEATGGWHMVPQFSDDGKWFGVNGRGEIAIAPLPEASLSAFDALDAKDDGYEYRARTLGFTTPADFMTSWDFVPGQDAIVLTGSEHMKEGPGERATGIRLETDGYDWKQIWYKPFPIREEVTEGNLAGPGLKKGFFKKHNVLVPKEQWDEWRPIPNTLRGMEPAVSPDGKKVAYLEYTDGTLNLVTINLDGSEKKHLTSFADGTWMQRIDWSPDGKQLVVGVFRNFQQDLYVMDADGSNVRPLMYDRWEDLDPHWAKDGRIYFSSDAANGIFNIFRYDPETKKIHQITNVIGGAEAPSITPEGNLLYSAYTGHGWKVYGVAKEDFLMKDVTSSFVLDQNPEAVKAAWEFREDLSAFVPRKYEGELMAPTGGPMFRVTNDGLDDMALQGGAWFFMQDFVENHGLFGQALLGEDTLLLAQYFYQGWYPTLYLTAYHYEVKYNYGFLLDDDGDTSTTEDQAIYEGKNHQFANIGMLALDYPWNGQFRTTAFGRYIEYGFRTTDEAKFEPYQFGTEAGITANFTNIGYQGYSSNPTGGRNVDLTYTFGYSDVVYKPYGGVSVDDGQLLDNYAYNKVEARWTEQIPVPAWGPLKRANSLRHTIQVDMQAGMMDRNVDTNDEFRAGGQHPYYWGSDSLRPNTLFAGYPGYSLSGETMALINLAYRFPIRRELNKRVGPFYFYDLTAQVMGSAGNLWSFRAPQDPDDYYRNEWGDRVARDESTIRREIPFVDYAYKNGNYLLYDAGVELRSSATLFNQSYWNSFVRVVYGFNEIRGYGDVNGDDIQDTTENAITSELSNETELPGLRLYVGLGTGW